jgi:hypothetical protein
MTIYDEARRLRKSGLTLEGVRLALIDGGWVTPSGRKPSAVWVRGALMTIDERAQHLRDKGLKLREIAAQMEVEGYTTKNNTAPSIPWVHYVLHREHYCFQAKVRRCLS